MSRIILGLVAGLIFGAGLVISGMSNPLKVQNFLDLFGTWDPSLAFVMGGAIGIGAIGFWLTGQLAKPLLTDVFDLPKLKQVDTKLLVGAGLFGIGWGITGVCPGPALTLIHLGTPLVFGLIAAMLLGMVSAKLILSRL